MDIGWPEIVIIAIVVLALFGSKKLPDFARSLGRSARILKTELKDLHDDDKPEQPASITAAPASTDASGQPVNTGDQAHAS